MPRLLLLVLLAALAAMLLVLALRPSAAGRRTLSARVLRAVDGDTLLVRLGGGARERVRLIGVDTPEDVAPGRPVECWSRRAARYTEDAATGRTVTLDVGREPRDRYGRLLAEVRVEGAARNLEEALLAGGFARPLAIAPNVDHAPLYTRLALAARRAGRGLWAACPALVARWDAAAARSP
jgi:micrococcal nuclease